MTKQNIVPYYPLPSNEGYEKFLQKMKKNQCIKYNLILDNKTQYSIPFLLSLQKKYEEKPEDMIEIKIPLKNEIRSRAKVLTEEAFRETRNYLPEENEIKNSKEVFTNGFQSYKRHNKFNNDNLNIDNKYISNQLFLKTNELREFLNKISNENYHIVLDQILKFNYDEDILENFKVT
jgi:hypothetical protein